MTDLMKNPLLMLNCLGLLLWLGSSACGPSRQLQKYDYLTQDAETYLKKEEGGTAPAPSERKTTQGKVSSVAEAPTAVAEPLPAEVDLIVQTALSYEGTPYRYGGTSRRGMDCSGLVSTAFQAADRTLPRTSSQMVAQGEAVPRRKIQPGHLVFFSAKGGKRIDHVGLVVAVEGDAVRFIHATTSQGVRVDQLSNPYWDRRFRRAAAF